MCVSVAGNMKNHKVPILPLRGSTWESRSIKRKGNLKVHVPFHLVGSFILYYFDELNANANIYLHLLINYLLALLRKVPQNIIFNETELYCTTSMQLDTYWMHSCRVLGLVGVVEQMGQHGLQILHNLTFGRAIFLGQYPLSPLS